MFTTGTRLGCLTTTYPVMFVLSVTKMCLVKLLQKCLSSWITTKVPSNKKRGSWERKRLCYEHEYFLALLCL